MERAREKNVGVVAMNPIGGGSLGFPNAVIEDLAPKSGLSSAGLALRFVLDNPHVTCAISGFSQLSDVEENVAVAKASPLSSVQRKVICERLDELDSAGEKFCTQCKYCMPCEQGVNIPFIFSLVNKTRG